MSDETEIKVVELGYHRQILTINGHQIGPERSSVCEFDEVRAWLKELPFVEWLPMISTVATDAADSDAGRVEVATMQEEVAEWAERNFGQTPSYRPLLGLCEELGEICAAWYHMAAESGEVHCIEDEPDAWKFIRAMAYMGKICHHQLKSEQGIRGTEAEHTAQMQENALSLLRCLRYSFGSTYTHIYHQHRSDLLRMPPFVVKDDISDGLGDLFVYACHFSHLTRIDLEEAIFSTWAKVKRRDWLKNNKTGDANETAEIRPVVVSADGTKQSLADWLQSPATVHSEMIGIPDSPE